MTAQADPLIEQIDRLMADESVEPFTFLQDLPLEQVWEKRGEAEEAMRFSRNAKDQIDQELARRFREARPDFDESMAGGADLAGDEIVVTMTWDRDYAYDEAELLELRKHLTQDEFDKVVAFVPKVNRVHLNRLEKRGGVVGEIIKAATKLKNARAKFDAKARQ